MQNNPVSGGMVTNLMSGLITEGPEYRWVKAAADWSDGQGQR